MRWASRNAISFIIGGRSLTLWVFMLQFVPAIVLAGGTEACRMAGRGTVQNVQIGWNGFHAVGKWTPVSVEVELPANVDDVVLELMVPDPDGNSVTFTSATQNLTEGHHQLSGLFRAGRLGSDVEVRLRHLDGWIIAHRVFRHDKPESGWQPTSKSALQIVLGLGFTEEALRKTVFADQPVNDQYRLIALNEESQLAKNSRAYDVVSALFIAGQPQLSHAALETLKEWVEHGGHLVWAPGVNASGSVASVPEWIPFKLLPEPISVRELGGLEAFVGRSERIQLPGRTTIARIKVNGGQVLARSGSDPLIARAPVGFGQVTILAPDLVKGPLTKWAGTPVMMQKLLNLSGESPNAVHRKTTGKQLTHAGISDLASQLHATQDYFPSLWRATPWWAMGFIGLAVLLIGPVDHFLVTRLLKRPQLTWFTLPAWLILLTGCALSAGQAGNTLKDRHNQLNLVDYDGASQLLRVRSWSTVYSTTAHRSTVEIQANSSSLHANESPAQHFLTWDGIPEDALGGMYRPSAFELSATPYQQLPEMKLKGVPFQVWSTKAFQGGWSATTTEPLFKSELTSTPVGTLQGSFQHRLPVPLDDWLIAYGAGVYRSLKSRDDRQSLPLAAGQVWRVNLPTVYQRELRGLLKEGEAIATGAKKGSGSLAVQVEAPYNSLSFDQLELVKVLTFHEELGGHGYTGLTNTLLNDLDLSRALQLGRAVLVARVKLPVTSFLVDGQPIPETHTETIVRAILPVERSNEPIRVRANIPNLLDEPTSFPTAPQGEKPAGEKPSEQPTKEAVKDQ